MAKIISRSQLSVGVELTIDETTSTFTLNEAGNLTAKDGVTLQALYSKFVELWSTSGYQDSEFPMYAIDALSGQFQFGTDGSTYSGWKPANDATRQMLRDGGWSEFDVNGSITRQYVGIVSLGDVSTGAQLYFQRDPVDPPTNFTFVDEANEGILVYGDALNGGFDKRSYFKSFVREQGKKYKDSVLSDTGKTATGAYLVNMLLSNEDDLDITHPDEYIGMDVAISSATWSAGFTEYTTSQPHGLSSGELAVVHGCVPVGLNVTKPVIVSSPTVFKVAESVDPGATVTTGSVNSIYNRITVKYLPTPISKLIGSVTPRDFGIVVDSGTHSGVDGMVTSGASTLTTSSGGVQGTYYTGGTLRVWDGADAGVYDIVGTPTGTVVTVDHSFGTTSTGVAFTIYPAVGINASLQQIYTKVQYLLRQPTNINQVGGAVIGKTASQLLGFVGAELKAGSTTPINPNGGGSGVLVEGLRANDLNTITLFDNAGVPRLYPYASTGTLSFNPVLVGVGSSYRLMFTTLPGSGNDYGEAGAVTVQNAAGDDITGVVGSGVISFDFDYDGNTQGGRTAGTDAAVTLIGIKPGSGKFAAATGIITRSKSNTLSLVAEQDRAYI